MPLRHLLLTLLFCLGLGTHAQTDSVRDMPHDTLLVTAAPQPVPEGVLRMQEALMPGGANGRWLPCKTQGTSWNGCHAPVTALHFDPEKEVVRAWPCAEDSLGKGCGFLIEQSHNDVVLVLTGTDRKYIIAEPNRCNRSCPGQASCIRLTKVRTNREPVEEIYLHKDTLNTTR